MAIVYAPEHCTAVCIANVIANTCDELVSLKPTVVEVYHIEWHEFKNYFS